MHIWLDDIRPMPSNFTHWAKTADDAIKLLRTGQAQTISLDYDLGPPNVGTGYDVAKFIELSARNDAIPFVRCMIHSSNPVGRADIGRAIDSANGYWADHGYATG